MPAKVELLRVGVHHIKVDPSWMDPIVAFLKDGMLPPDRRKIENIQKDAPCFWLSKEHKLYM